MRKLFINFSSLFFPGLTWKIPTKSKKIFLTFDDGPHPNITPKVLNILDDYNAKATFFCVGENAEIYPLIYQQILSSGHQCGNHTYNHLKGWNTKKKDYLENVYKCRHLVDSELFRPPHGRISPSQIITLTKEGYSIIMWSVLSKDYKKKMDKKKLLQNAIKRTKSGSIIVFHDSKKAEDNLLYLLPKYLDYFKNKGYSFELI